MHDKVIDDDLQEKFRQIWKPVKEQSVVKLEEFRLSTYGIPNNEIRSKIHKLLDEIQRMLHEKLTFPFLHVNELSQEEVEKILEK